MNRRATTGLIALNGVLVVILAAVSLSPRAGAQSNRPRGSYTMVGGQIQGGSTNAIYVMDSSSQELVALRWDQSSKRFAGIGWRSLAADAKAGKGR